MDIKKKRITLYICVNKDKDLRMFISEPHREGNMWVGQSFVSWTIYSQIKPIIEKSQMTFESDPEVIQFDVPIFE